MRLWRYGDAVLAMFDYKEIGLPIKGGRST
jgi:hypothetical protein